MPTVQSASMAACCSVLLLSVVALHAQDIYCCDLHLLLHEATCTLAYSLQFCGSLCRLHTVHDEEKPFEIEMAWICDDSKKKFAKVPADLVAEADKAAKDALNSDM